MLWLQLQSKKVSQKHSLELLTAVSLQEALEKERVDVRQSKAGRLNLNVKLDQRD